MWTQPAPSPNQSPADSFPVLRASGASIDAYHAIVELPRVEQVGPLHVLLIPGSPPAILFASQDRAQVDWIDFSIELVLGLVGLFTGFRLGREGYEIFRPLIDDLYANDPGFREKVELAGAHALTGDAGKTGTAVIGLWLYLWRHHRGRLVSATLRAIGRAFNARRLFLLLLRWALRLVSAGAALTLEIGLLALPLNGKLHPK